MIAFILAGATLVERQGKVYLAAVLGDAAEAATLIQAHIAQARSQRIDVGQQIVRARLFTRFNQTHNARVRCVLIFQSLNSRNAGVGSVAIVGTTAAIQLALFVFRRPGAQVVAPTTELGLLVQVAIHQDRLAGAFCGSARGGHLEKQHRCASRQLNDLQRQAFHLLRFDPLRGVAQHGFQVAVFGPLRIK